MRELSAAAGVRRLVGRPGALRHRPAFRERVRGEVSPVDGLMAAGTASVYRCPLCGCGWALTLSGDAAIRFGGRDHFRQERGPDGSFSCCGVLFWIDAPPAFEGLSNYRGGHSQPGTAQCEMATGPLPAGDGPLRHMRHGGC